MEQATRPRRWSTRHQLSPRLLVALGAVVAALVALAVLFDWNWLRRPLERAVQLQTGRSFHIDGDLSVDLGRITTVSGEGLRLGNADWSATPQMASAARAEIDLHPWPLLLGRLRVDEIRLTRPLLLLESAPVEGQPGNWVFRSGKGAAPGPNIRRLRIDSGTLRFVDARNKTDLALKLQSTPPPTDRTASAVAIEGRGTWRGSPFLLEGHSESPLQLSDSEHPFQVDLSARAGATRAKVKGTLTHPFQFQQFDLQLQLSGQDMEDLYPLLGLALPPTPPYRLDGRLSRAQDLWRYADFKGQVGDSDLAGTAEVEVGRPRPRLKANLSSRLLDFDDLAGFIGAPPKTGPNETANAAQKKQSAELAASPRLLPQQAYNLAKLRAMDADVRWKAARINAPSWPIDDMHAHLLLEDGRLQLAPLNFGVAGGDIRATVAMDARSAPIKTHVEASLAGVQLGKLFPDSRLAGQAAGGISGQINLKGQGNSIAAMLASSNGDVAIGMGRGHVGNLMMELAGLDVAETLKFLITGDRQIPLRCAFADFSVKAGQMQSRAMAFDSSDTLIVGEGRIDLENETLDLLLKPRPKDRSILALRTPLRVAGTFKAPSLRPDSKALGIRGAVALTLASVAPPAALLATLETGPGEDSSCGGQYAH